VTLLLSFGEELLDCGEDHAAGLPLQQFAEVCPAFGLDRGLADMFAAPCEGVEELAVEVVLVGEDDEVVPSGVFEVEDLREAVACPPRSPGTRPGCRRSGSGGTYGCSRRAMRRWVR